MRNAVRGRTLRIGSALALAGMLALAPQGAGASRLREVPRTGGNAILSHLDLTVNKSRTVKTDVPFGDVLVGLSEVADVVPISDRTLYILGKKIGTTNVSLFDADKKLVGLIDLEVKPDTAAIQSQVRQSDGGAGLSVRSQGDRIVLSGLAPDGPSVDRAMQVAPAGTINLTRVRSPQQVMLKVRFVEVNRSAGRDLGVRLESTGTPRLSVGAVGPTTQISSSTATNGVSVSGLLGTAINAATASAVPFGTVAGTIGLGRGAGQLDIFISALENKGLLRRLAEPNLIAMSGERAEFLAGGEIPIPIANQTVNGSPQITVSYKEFGVKLAFTPTVLTNGNIYLQLEPEVSDIDPTLAVAVGGGVSVPGLTKRRAKTNVELRDGQSFAIAGLLQHQTNRSLEQLPYLGSLPIIGALLRSTDYQERETELVVIITPALVKPARPGDPLSTPLDTTVPANDVDFVANGQLEVRRDNRAFVSRKGRVIGPYGHLLPPAGPVVYPTN